jgi:hypothetical protein
LETNGVLLGQPKVESLDELNAQPEVKQVEQIEKVAVAKVDELEVTEITD